jgi:cold shock CspA family protein
MRSEEFNVQVPLQVVFEHVSPSEFVENRVRVEAAKLEQFYDRITSARIVIGRPQHRHHKGDTYSVRLHLTVPGASDITISRDPAATGRHEDVQVTISDAFDAARRKLQDTVRKRQGQVKAHEVPPHGTISSLAPDRDHGFIASADGREIYFHRNSVEGGNFDDLEVGQEVRFSESIGDKGPQATFVHPIGKRHTA